MCMQEKRDYRDEYLVMTRHVKLTLDLYYRMSKSEKTHMGGSSQNHERYVVKAIAADCV